MKLALAPLAALALAPAAHAQLAIRWSTIDAGGTTTSAAGAFALRATLAQPDAGSLAQGPYALTGGFWAFTTPAPACDPDLNQDGNADQDDIAYLINVIGGGANPTGIDPDFNRDGNADQDDVSSLIEVVAGGTCP